LRRAALLGIGSLSIVGLAGLTVRVAQRGAAGAATSGVGASIVSHQLGWLKGVQFGGDFIAQERGYFEQEGLDVRYTAGGPGTDYRTLVASGRMLISESNVQGMIDSYLQGQPLVAFAAVLQKDPGAFLSSPARPITSLRDMVGKTIGVPNSIRAQFSTLLKRANVNPDDVKLVPVGSDPSLLAAGQVDAYYSWATTAVPALRAAHFEPHVLLMSDIGLQGYGQVLIARRDALEKNHDLYVRYTRALIKGWRWMVEHPSATAEIVVRSYAPPGTSLTEQMDQARMMTPYIATGDALTKGLLWISPEVFEANVELAKEAGVIAPGTKVDISRIVTQSVMKAALGT
jgi:NitT/TauT family transport system substrate-binding protein